MKSSTADRTLSSVVVALPVLGCSAVLTGFSVLGVVLIVAGLLLALAGRGRIARSIRMAPPTKRASRLRGAAICLAAFVAALIGYGVVISDEEASTLGLVSTSVTGTAALAAGLVLLMAGLLTPRSTQPTP